MLGAIPGKLTRPVRLIIAIGFQRRIQPEVFVTSRRLQLVAEYLLDGLLVRDYIISDWSRIFVTKVIGKSDVPR